MSRRQKSTSNVRLGNRTVDYNTLKRVNDSRELWANRDLPALRQRLVEDGFVFIRGVVPRRTALRARHLLLETVKDKGAIAPGTDYRDGIIASKPRGGLVPGYTVDAQSGGLVDERDDDVDGWLQVGISSTMRDIYDGSALRSFLSEIFDGPDMYETLPENTWLRLKGKGDVTIEHADYYYFKKSTDMFENYSNSENRQDSDDLCLVCHTTATTSKRICGLCHRPCHLDCIDRPARTPSKNWQCSHCADSPIYIYTCWTSLSDISLADSTLAFVPGSQKLTGFDRARKSQSEVPATYNKESTLYIPEGEIGPGDIFLFNVKTVHCASENTTGAFRASVDTRLQLTAKGRRHWQQLIPEQ